MSELPKIGTIVRIVTFPKGTLPDPLAVVVPPQFAANYQTVKATETSSCFTRLLDDRTGMSFASGVDTNGGWWIWKKDFEIVPEESVPDDIAALATRVLLDPDFIPFKEQT
jgi:hypothetical protein